MLHKNIFDQAPVGLIFVDHNFTCAAVNSCAAVLLKHTVEEVTARPLRDVLEKAFGPEVAAELEKQARRTLLSGEHRTISTSPGHSARPNTLSDIEIRPIYDDNCEVLGAILTFAGAPRRTALLSKLREKLQESERRFRAIFDQTFEFIGLLKPDGTVIEGNRTALDFAGVQLSDVIDKPAWETPWFAHSKEEQERLKAAIAQAAQGKFVRYETTHPHRDGGTVIVDFSIKPVKDKTGKIVLLIPEGRDVTDLKRAEEERDKLMVEKAAEQARQESEEELRQARKMDALGRLAGGIAHDFNNLLSVICGYSELLLLKMDRDDPLHKDVENIQRAAGTAASLTKQLLAFSRREQLALEVLDLNTIVSDFSKMLPRIIRESIELTAVLAADAGGVRVSAGQIEQVIMNLAVNARDAMPTGGRLTIETRNVYLSESDTQQRDTIPAGRYVCLEVSDTGSGMDACMVSQVFDPYFSTKARGEGTGLGLSVVYGIVRQAGGHIRIDSELGQGTTVKVYLPRVEETVAPAATDLKGPRLVRGTETILLVEDSEALRQMERAFLEMLGYQVLEARNGHEAIDLVERSNTRIHLLLTDVIMPGLSGPELAKQMAGLRPRTKVLYASGYTGKLLDLYGVSGSKASLIEKPFSFESLARKVRETLDEDSLKRRA